KIGYPDRWRDYSSLTISQGAFYDNVVRAAAFEARRNLAKIGKPVDRAEWTVPPALVNAYYDAAQNEIVVPAGILQPPFFSAAADDAVKYGGIWAAIRYESSPCFSDQGGRVIPERYLRDWWTR